MKRIEIAILSLIAAMMAGIQALYAQANDIAPLNKDNHVVSDYLWPIGLGVVVIAIIAAVVYQRRHRKDNNGSLTGDINNPASGI